jgi:hypothetical protein
MPALAPTKAHNDTEKTTSQINTLELQGDGLSNPVTKATSLEEIVDQLETFQLSSGYFTGSRSLGPEGGFDTTFICPGQPNRTIKRNRLKSTSGVLHSPDGRWVTATSGYNAITGRHEHQLDNEDDNDKLVMEMCKDLDYPLSCTDPKDQGRKGRFMAARDEKRLLAWFYTHNKALVVYFDCCRS